MESLKQTISSGDAEACASAPGEERRTPGGRREARGTGAEAEGDREVGGLNRSEEDGERAASGPVGAKGARAEMNLRRET